MDINTLKRLLWWLPDKAYLQLYYFLRFKRLCNFKDPKTFNEKLQWLKLYNRKPVYTELVDKYAVRKHIANAIGEEHLIPLVGGPWNSFDEIDFDALPEQFVLKCTHDCDSVIICKDKSKLDKAAAEKRLCKCLKNNYYSFGREWPYKNLKPRIIAERFMEDKENGELRDYKFFCFNGKVKCFKVDFDRFTDHKANYFDVQGERLAFGEKACPPDFNKELKLPDNLQEMVTLAEKLSAGHPFLRVDFYSLNGNIFFGELTFFPASGMGVFTPDSWDDSLGSWIDLSEIKNNSTV